MCLYTFPSTNGFTAQQMQQVTLRWRGEGGLLQPASLDVKCLIHFSDGTVDKEHRAIGGCLVASFPSHGQQRAVDSLVTIAD